MTIVTAVLSIYAVDFAINAGLSSLKMTISQGGLANRLSLQFKHVAAV